MPSGSKNLRARPGISAAHLTVGNSAWAFGDQAVSSAGNFLLIVVLARSSSADAFGSVALLLSIYTFTTTMCFALVGEVFLMAGSSLPSVRLARDASIGLSLGVGLCAGALLAAMGIALHGEARWCALALALGQPLLICQDTQRYVMFGTGRARAAFTMDASWLATWPLLAALAAQSGLHGPVPALASWVVVGGLSSLGAMLARTGTPNLGAVRSLLRDTRSLRRTQSAEFIAVAAENQGFVLILTTIVGSAAVGGYRGAQSLFGPLNVLFLAVRGGLLSRATRVVAGGRILGFVSLVTVGLASATALGGIALLLVAPSVGPTLLGATWPSSSRILTPLAVQYLGLAAAVPALLGLRALRAGVYSRAARVRTTAIYLLSAALGADIGGLRGAVLGLAAAALVSACDWQLSLRRAARADQAHRTALETASPPRTLWP